jgi:ABC-type polar amino acid transport system ATPase subunit
VDGDNLAPTLTAVENVQFSTQIAANPMGPAESMKLVDLSEQMHHFLAQMSGGQQQRVSIARALAKRLAIMLCDEPTGALDAHTGRRVPVIIAFDPEAGKELEKRGHTLGLAYRVRVRVYTREKTDVLKIPRNALFRGAGDQWEVFTVKAGRAALTGVTLGIVNDDEAEVTGGLKSGDAVILVPPKALRNGDRVKLS